jgi:hypothetical protein
MRNAPPVPSPTSAVTSQPLPSSKPEVKVFDSLVEPPELVQATGRESERLRLGTPLEALTPGMSLRDAIDEILKVVPSSVPPARLGETRRESRPMQAAAPAPTPPAPAAQQPPPGAVGPLPAPTLPPMRDGARDSTREPRDARDTRDTQTDTSRMLGHIPAPPPPMTATVPGPAVAPPQPAAQNGSLPTPVAMNPMAKVADAMPTVRPMAGSEPPTLPPELAHAALPNVALPPLTTGGVKTPDAQFPQLDRTLAMEAPRPAAEL